MLLLLGCLITSDKNHRWPFRQERPRIPTHPRTCMFEMCCNRSDSEVAGVWQSDVDWVQEPAVEPGRHTQSLRARTVAWASSPHLQVRVMLGKARM